MRVIAGTLKGRQLATPGWTGLRPTSDKLRETLFNVLADRVAGARVLDGYAGTGAVGIEALSRGAAHVIFVERDARALALIRENLGRCGLRGGYAIIRADVRPALRRRLEGAEFDLIFLDPPYDVADPAPLVADAAERLAGGGVLVLEHAARLRVPDQAGSLTRIRQIRSGDSALALFARSAAAER